MRLKKSTRVSIEQVRITREGDGAIVDHADAGISGAHLAIGPEIATMTDAEIVDLYNGILESQHRLLVKGPVAIYVGIDWRVFGRHEAIRSCGEVNDLIVWFLGEGLPSVDLAHGDLS